MTQREKDVGLKTGSKSKMRMTSSPNPSSHQLAWLRRRKRIKLSVRPRLDQVPMCLKNLSHRFKASTIRSRTNMGSSGQQRSKKILAHPAAVKKLSSRHRAQNKKIHKNNLNNRIRKRAQLPRSSISREAAPKSQENPRSHPHSRRSLRRKKMTKRTQLKTTSTLARRGCKCKVSS
jgi:hypothetical protein